MNQNNLLLFNIVKMTDGVIKTTIQANKIQREKKIGPQEMLFTFFFLTAILGKYKVTY